MGIVIRKNFKILGFVGSYAGVIAGMFVYYIVTPVLIIFFKDVYYNNIGTYGFKAVIQQIIEVDTYSYIRTILFILIGFITFDFSYKVRTPIKKKKYMYVNKGKFHEDNLFYYIKIARLLSLICIPSMIIYVIGLGGPFRVLQLAENLRKFDVTISLYTNPFFGFFNMPAAFVPICSLLWLYISKQKRTFVNRLVFCFTFFLSVFYCLIDAGRTKLLIYFFCVLYITFRKKIHNIWRWIFLSLPLGIVFIDVLSGIFEFFQTNDISRISISNMVFYNVIRQFSYPMRTLLHLPQIMKKNNYLFFKNFVLDTIGLLPMVNFDKSYFVITEYFNGTNWRSLGGVPSDLLSYGYINLSVFGIIVITWCLGKLCFWYDSYLKKQLSNDSRHFWGIIMAGAMFYVVASADWSTIIYNNCTFTVPIIIFFLDSKSCRDRMIIKKGCSDEKNSKMGVCKF